MASDNADAVLRRYAARNFWLNVLDGMAFIFGISMLSRFTVLPLFVERLGGGAFLQGLIPTIFYIGWLLPGLFMAPLVASRPRRKPIILTATIGERMPFLLLGLVLVFAPTLPAATLLGVFFAIFVVYSFSAGFASTAYQDFISRIIPQQRWGTFFGVQSGIGGVFGVVGAWVATRLLATQPFPQSVGMLALLCFGAQIISYAFLASTVEPPQHAPPRTPWREFLGGIGPLLQRNAAFRRYLFCRTAIALGFVGHSFLTASLLARFTVADAEIGIFTVVLLAAQALANVGLGWLADRWGHKQVLELSTVLGVLALLAAIAAPSALWFYLVFVLMGAAQAGYTLSGFTLIFAFSTPAERPTYIGVANTALAPAAALGPLVAGALASIAGYNILFLLLSALGIVGLLVLHWRVQMPAAVPGAVGEA